MRSSMSRWRRTLVLAGACAALAPVRAPAQRRRRGVVLLADDAEECDVFDPSPECLTEAEAMSCGAWEECSFNVGDRVRVVSDAVVYHHPKHKAGLAVRGLVGSVSGLASVARDGSGAALSANRPVVVQFEEPRLTAHFEEGELELDM